jgi:SAM-dependent methyltransferase
MAGGQRTVADAMGDQTLAHPARMYDYWLGGKDNFAVDRMLAERVAVNAPAVMLACRENRAFLGRAARYAAAVGIRQFVDIGAGFPTMGNTNQVVHAVAPEARVVYVDNDPVVLAHGRALLAGRDASRTRMVAGDLRAPERILAAPELAGEVDLDRPVALMLVAIMHFIRDAEDPAGILDRLRGALAPGSLLIFSHATFDFDLRILNNARVYNDATAPFVPRARAQVERLLEGFELVEPGLVELPLWRPDGARPIPSEHVGMYAAVGRRP